MLALDPDAVVWNFPAEVRHQKSLLILMHGRGSDEHDLAALCGDCRGVRLRIGACAHRRGLGLVVVRRRRRTPRATRIPENADLVADARADLAATGSDGLPVGRNARLLAGRRDGRASAASGPAPHVGSRSIWPGSWCVANSSSDAALDHAASSGVLGRRRRRPALHSRAAARRRTLAAAALVAHERSLRGGRALRSRRTSCATSRSFSAHAWSSQSVSPERLSALPRR